MAIIVDDTGQQEPQQQPATQQPERDAYDDILDRQAATAPPPVAAAQEPQAQGPDVYDQILDRQQQQAGQQLLTSFQTAVKANPDLAGEAQRMGIDLGVDPLTAERNIDKVRELYAVRNARLGQLAAGNTVLGRQLMDPAFARIAHDQVHHLGYIENVLANLESGQLQTERSLLYERIRQGLPIDQARMTAVTNRLAELPSQAGGFVAGAAKLIGQQVETLPKAFAAGGAMAGTALALGQAGPQAFIPEELVSVPGMFSAGFLATLAAQTGAMEAGGAYGDMIEAGYDPAVASRAAFGVGLANAALEMVGAHFLAKGAGVALGPIRSAITRGEVHEGVVQALVKPTLQKGAMEFAKGYLEGLGGEVVTETMQEAVSATAEEIARRYSEHPESLQSSVTRGEVLQRLYDTAAQTAEGMALLALPGPVLRLRNDIVRARRAEQAGVQLQALADGSVESKVRQRNPAAYEGFVDAKVAGTPAENVYIDGQAFQQILQQAGTSLDEIGKQLPEVVKAAAEAESTGGDVVIPTKVFAAHIAGTPLGDAMAGHMRLDPEGMSPLEAEAFRQEQKGLTDQMVKEAGDRVASDAEVARSAGVVEDAMRKQLQETGKLQPKEVDASAAFYRDFVVVQSQRAGLTPEEFHAKYPLTVAAAQLTTSGGDTQNALMQLVPDNWPEREHSGLRYSPGRKATTATFKTSNGQFYEVEANSVNDEAKRALGLPVEVAGTVFKEISFANLSSDESYGNTGTGDAREVLRRVAGMVTNFADHSARNTFLAGLMFRAMDGRRAGIYERLTRSIGGALSWLRT